MVLQTWGLLEVARDAVLARAAQAGGKDADAIDLWQKAAATEDTIPYMEPPYWYYPVRTSLEAALLKSGRRNQPRRSAAALERARDDGRALHGLAESAKASGDDAAAKKADAAFAKGWRGDPAMLSLERL